MPPPAGPAAKRSSPGAGGFRGRAHGGWPQVRMSVRIRVPFHGPETIALIILNCLTTSAVTLVRWT